MVSSPQKENGYTAIANEIMEVLAAYRLPGEQMQCLLFVLRKTYGFNKKSDEISISQFQLATGLKKPSVSRAINGLLKKGIIRKKLSGRVATYWFNKNYDFWRSQAKKNTYTPVSSLVKRCYLCGFDEVIDKHHIIHQADGGSDRVENIIMLCPNCQTKVHRGLLNETDLLDHKKQVEDENKKPLTKKLTENNEPAVNSDCDHSKNINKKVKAPRSSKKPLTKKLPTKDNITKDSNILSYVTPDISDFCKKFIEYIQKTKTNLAPSGADLFQNSADAVDKLIRLDGFSLDYIKQVLWFAVNDDFWSDNILSLAGLRRKKDGLSKFQKIANSFEKSKKKKINGDGRAAENARACHDFVYGDNDE